MSGTLQSQHSDGAALPEHDYWRYLFEEPPPLRALFDGIEPGTVGGLFGAGGSYKSTFLLQFSIAVAAAHCGIDGTDTLGLGLNRDLCGRVVYFDLENSRQVVWHRVRAIATVHGWLKDQARLNAIADALKQNFRHFETSVRIDVCDGKSVSLMSRECEGAALIGVDTLTRVHTADENDNGQMSRVMGQFETVAQQTGATVVVAGHTSKAAALNGSDLQQAARGASAIVDNPRFCMTLSKLTKREVVPPKDAKKSEKFEPPCFQLRGARRAGVAVAATASNYHQFVRLSAPKPGACAQPADRWFWMGGGCLQPVDLVSIDDDGLINMEEGEVEPAKPAKRESKGMRRRNADAKD